MDVERIRSRGGAQRASHLRSNKRLEGIRLYEGQSSEVHSHAHPVVVLPYNSLPRDFDNTSHCSGRRTNR